MNSRRTSALSVLAALSLVLALGVNAVGAESALAGTASNAGYLAPSGQLQHVGPGASSILVLNTTTITRSVARALNALGYTYDEIDTSVFTGIDFSTYDTVIVTMDGGTISTASVGALRAGVVNAGKNLILFGGTCYQPFANGVNQYLVQIDTVNYCWTISSSPGLHLLAHNALTAGLPDDYSWVNSSAGFYMARPTDPAILKLAQNGDGYTNYLAKGSRAVHILWFTSSPFDSYWTDPSDYQVLATIVHNTLAVSN